jgi:HAD superfamily hydrolase (TIGR01509 family)
MEDLLSTKQCFIFDMDGTLINLEELNHTSYSNTIKEFFDMEIDNDDYQKYFSGTRTAKAFEGYLESKNITEFNTDELIKHFRKQKRYNLENNFDNCVTLINGAREYLKLLKSNNKTIILATSTIKDFVDIIVDKLQLSEFFNHVITAEDISNGKPDPEIFLLAIKKANLEKSNAVVFEDSKNGISAGLASGILCVGIHTKGLNDKWVTNADIVIGDYNEILLNN